LPPRRDSRRRLPCGSRGLRRVSGFFGPRGQAQSRLAFGFRAQSQSSVSAGSLRSASDQGPPVTRLPFGSILKTKTSFPFSPPAFGPKAPFVVPVTYALPPASTTMPSANSPFTLPNCWIQSCVPAVSYFATKASCSPPGDAPCMLPVIQLFPAASTATAVPKSVSDDPNCRIQLWFPDASYLARNTSELPIGMPSMVTLMLPPTYALPAASTPTPLAISPSAPPNWRIQRMFPPVSSFARKASCLPP